MIFGWFRSEAEKAFVNYYIIQFGSGDVQVAALQSIFLKKISRAEYDGRPKKSLRYWVASKIDGKQESKEALKKLSERVSNDIVVLLLRGERAEFNGLWC
jgi:hypothetical protein